MILACIAAKHIVAHYRTQMRFKNYNHLLISFEVYFCGLYFFIIYLSDLK